MEVFICFAKTADATHQIIFLPFVQVTPETHFNRLSLKVTLTKKNQRLIVSGRHVCCMHDMPALKNQLSCFSQYSRFKKYTEDTAVLSLLKIISLLLIHSSSTEMSG